MANKCCVITDTTATSRGENGRLAEAAYPARVLSLILSDVIGDRMDSIASGPISPDKTT